MNKNQFMDCLCDLVLNDFSYLIIDAKTEDNYLDFVLTGVDFFVSTYYSMLFCSFLQTIF